MAFSGFGKNSGPTAPPPAQNPFGHFQSPPTSSSPFPVPPRSPVDYGDLGASKGMASPPLASSRPFPGTYKSNEPSLRRDDMKAPSVGDRGPQTYQRPPGLQPRMVPSNTRIGTLAEAADVQNIGRNNSLYSHSPQEVSKNFRGVSEMPSDLPLSNKRYMVPYRAQSPQLAFQNDQNVGGQLPHHDEAQQRHLSSPVRVNPSKSSVQNIRPPAQEGISLFSTGGGTYQSEPFLQTNNANGGPLHKRTRSPTPPFSSGLSAQIPRSDGHRRSLIDYRDLDAPEEMPSLPLASGSSFPSRNSSGPFSGNQKPFPSSPVWVNQSSNNSTTPVQEDMSVWTKKGNYQSGRMPETKNADVQLPKRTRSPTLPSTSGSLSQNPSIPFDGNKRMPGFQSQSQSALSEQFNSVEDAIEKPMPFPAVKRTKIPPQSSSDQVSEDNLDHLQETERELQAKAKRLARFKDELSQPVQSHSTIKSQKAPAKRQHQIPSEKQKFSEDPGMDVMGDSAGANLEHEASSRSIVGLCQDMCPESERAERERKGDLDQYERLDGDRNLTSEYLAVKKYTRTAEREADLIRPLPILQKTMEYLLNLLDEPYDDRFLGLYNFLWDRMRAIRMDLRMQHIFNLEAISLLEQMIRLHIIAMHELCEYTKGEGFSEGFDAHLNIEQMNKTSVELFQFYDDHRKKGLHVPTEKEFRGYYALLKLDKHPGYKVEPAELSLDLAKMTPEMRQTPEVLFARDVARACRTGNFIAFFRLARKATYLQACLMHAHFSKLRTQALASLHSGLQSSQGIPITHVAKWLGMEEEDIESLLEYYGFSTKEFEEPYMVKEGAFLNVDNDFPVKRSKLVERKRSRTIANDVTFPSTAEEYTAEEVQEFQHNKDPEPKIPTPSQLVVPSSTTQLHDEEMSNVGSTLSPKGSTPKPLHKTFTDLTTPDEKVAGREVHLSPASPFVLEFPNTTSEQLQTTVESTPKPKYDSVFRNSFGRSTPHDIEATPQTTVIADENISTSMGFDSVVHSPIQHPMFTEEQEDEQTSIMEEDKCDEATTSCYDEEVAVAKLKLILRIWKCRTTKKRELREHKQLAASAALNLLSVGPPICHFEEQSGNYGLFNIDNVVIERREIQERSWSVLNPSNIIATKLISKNPDSKCLCWKLVFYSPEKSHGDKSSLSAAYLWLRSKLMSANNDVDDDLLVSSPDTAIWKSWFPSQSGLDLTCCLSVIKNTTSEDLNQEITGSSAVLFMLSDNIPLELQKKRLHDLVMSLPSDSRLPLLILSGSSKEESDPSIIAKELGLHDLDRSRVIMLNIDFLKDKNVKNLDGFFSDERLREGLEWLASESPQQIIVKGIKTRELVLSHLNPIVEVLDEMKTHRIGPNNCVSAFNEALDQSVKDIAAAAQANPTGWPCPEIDLLEESYEEYRFACWYLPSIGWSSASRTEMLMGALNDMKIPSMDDDLSWLYSGVNNGDDIENMKSRLENCLINYLTQTSHMMGISLAQKEAVTLVQNFTGLELHNMTYYIVPKWASIFRRIFSWRLMKLNSGEVSSTYVLQSFGAVDNSISRSIAFLPPYVANPSLDELVEVGCGSQGLGLGHMAYDAALPPRSPSPMAASDGADLATSDGNVMLQSEEYPAQDSDLISYDNVLPVKDSYGGQVTHKATKEADRLSELLDKCNIVQNMIEEKLSIYF